MRNADQEWNGDMEMEFLHLMDTIAQIQDAPGKIALAVDLMNALRGSFK